MTKNTKKKFVITRDMGIYVVALGILIQQAFSTATEKTTLIYIAGALLGLPVVLSLNAIRRNGNGKDDN